MQVNTTRAAVLMGPTGDLRHLSDPKIMPQMCVIKSRDVLVYDGAIDVRPVGEVPRR